MKVYKFGGASVRDAGGVRNVAKVLEAAGFRDCILVVSAMGKTTNALEAVVERYFKGRDYKILIEDIASRHLAIAEELFPAGHGILGEISMLFNDAASFLEADTTEDYDYIYDQTVSCGELASSKLLSAYLNENSYENIWLDARALIRTDKNYREGNVDWSGTTANVRSVIKSGNYVTQGFIGGSGDSAVTLGREGSDYSAAIFANAANAAEMTIWKDVPGVMTGDPRKFENTRLIPQLSYEEAIEMAYYGASIIHPKTLQPLKEKKIPFYVKSFLQPEKTGTRVGDVNVLTREKTLILKENQVLARVSTKNFSFIAEEHLSVIFSNLAKFKIKISLMQNTAISLQLCLDDKFGNIRDFAEALSDGFSVDALPGVSLFTMKNTKNFNDKFLEGKNILLEQISSNTCQMVIN